MKEELSRVHPELDEMRKRKFERRNQFIEVQEQIQSISDEIYSTGEYITAIVVENDLSLRKLEELHRELLALQKEKVNNLIILPPFCHSLSCICVCVNLDQFKPSHIILCYFSCRVSASRRFKSKCIP